MGADFREAEAFICFLRLQVLLPNSKPHCLESPLSGETLYCIFERPSNTAAMVPLINIKPLELDWSFSVSYAWLDGALRQLDKANYMIVVITGNDYIDEGIREVIGDGG